MTLNDTTNLTTTSHWRKRVGVVFAAVVLGASLTACGSSPGDTTCGEVRDMSTDERIDLLEEGIEDEGSDEDKEAFEAAPDEAKEAGAEALVVGCEDEDDDTKLDDVEAF